MHDGPAAGARGKKLRVAHVTTVSEFVRYILMHDLRRWQDRVESTVFCAPGDDLEAVRNEGIRVVEIPIERKIAPASDLLAMAHLFRALRGSQFDVIHSWVPKGGFVGQIAGAAAGIPVRVHSVRGLLYSPGLSGLRRRLYRTTDKLTFHLAHATVFNSEADRVFAVEEGLCPADRAVYTGTGIDLTHFRPSDDARRDGLLLRERLGLGEGQRVVLTVGRFVPEKGYPELLEVARMARRQRPDVRFVWVAPVTTGEADALSESAVADSGLGGTVVRVGKEDDVRAFYALADVLVHPSHREGVPRVIMEAAAMGVPVVATDIAGSREVLTHQESGLLVPVGDPPAIWTAVMNVLDNRDAARQRAVTAQNIVLRRFDADGHAERILEVYERLARHSTRGMPAS